MSTLTFKKCTINSYGGINKENPIVLVFPTDKRIAKLSGDQDMNKSSTIKAILYACGYEFDIAQKHFINLKDGTINIDQEFEKDGKTYRVKATKSKFELMRLYKDEGKAERWIPEGSPKALLSELIPIGISPDKLIHKDGKAQIQWLYEMLKVPQEVLKEEEDLLKKLDTATKSRTAANKEFESLSKLLSAEPMFQQWLQSEQKYKEEKKMDDVKLKFEIAEKRKNDFEAAKVKLKDIDNKIVTKQSDIKELEEKLAAAKKDLKDLQLTKKKGEKYVEDNAAVVQEYETAKNELWNIQQYIVEWSQWQVIKQRKGDKDSYETLVQKGDSLKDGIRKSLRELVAKILPKLEGYQLEVVADEAIDGKSTGIYINGKTPAQLNESDLFNFYLQLCDKKGTGIVAVENITSFGSAAIETLNKLSQKGVYIFATEMKRGQKAMKIEFIDELI